MFTLEEVKDKLRWQAAGVGIRDANGKRSGDPGFDYKTIEVDEEYAQKLTDGYDLVFRNGGYAYEEAR